MTRRPKPKKDRGERGLSLTALQLRDAASLVDPDATDANAEDEVTIVWKDEWIDIEDKKTQPAGFYAYLTEYPEEGLYGPLGDTAFARDLREHRDALRAIAEKRVLTDNDSPAALAKALVETAQRALGRGGAS